MNFNRISTSVIYLSFIYYTVVQKIGPTYSDFKWNNKSKKIQISDRIICCTFTYWVEVKNGTCKQLSNGRKNWWYTVNQITVTSWLTPADLYRWYNKTIRSLWLHCFSILSDLTNQTRIPFIGHLLVSVQYLISRYAINYSQIMSLLLSFVLVYVIHHRYGT